MAIVLAMIMWLITAFFIWQMIRFRKGNAANIKKASQDGSMVQITEKRRKILRFVWYVLFGLFAFMAIGFTGVAADKDQSAVPPVAQESKTTENQQEPAKIPEPQTIKPYPYQIIAVEGSDFAGRRRSAVHVLVYETSVDNYNAERLTETARDAAKKCGRVSQAYIVYLYDREVDARQNTGVTVGMMNIGKWSGSENENEKVEIYSEDDRNFRKEMNDKQRAERKSN